MVSGLICSRYQVEKSDVGSAGDGRRPRVKFPSDDLRFASEFRRHGFLYAVLRVTRERGVRRVRETIVEMCQNAYETVSDVYRPEIQSDENSSGRVRDRPKGRFSTRSLIGCGPMSARACVCEKSQMFSSCSIYGIIGQLTRKNGIAARRRAR